MGSLAILADGDQSSRPSEYVEQTEESSVLFRFQTAKLLDWVGREVELDAHAEPFALIVRARPGQRALPGRTWPRRPGIQVAARAAVHRRFQDAADVRRWYRYLDWFLTPCQRPDEKACLARVNRFEEEQNVPFITSAERIGIEKMVRVVLRGKFGAEGEAAC